MATPPPNPNPGTLYVFLHGLFVVRETPQPPQFNPFIPPNPPAGFLEVVLPTVPGHVYRAGGWLAETEIALGNDMYLLGVDPGNDTLRFTIDLPQTSLTSQKRAATLWLYKPQQILSLLHTTVDTTANPADYVVRTQDQQSPFTDIATVQVLIYQYRDENNVMLDGHTWEPCAAQGGAISLHIISTSPEPEGEEHEIRTNEVLKDVLKGYPGLAFKNNPRPLAAPWINPNDPNYGDYQSRLEIDPGNGDRFIENGTQDFAFLHAELEHLMLRTARLGRLGRLKQSGQPIEGVWSDPDPLADRASNCGTIKPGT
ncbi:MAG TPA: hypothetical protein VHA33_11015 [Candidatus Angelobacter sp.]|jgi:hypothetical protein|nr:hypothetical protein [Candidatus Angelobacter sp.]